MSLAALQGGQCHANYIFRRCHPAKRFESKSWQNHPVLLTSRGRGAAVVQDLRAFEKAEEECSFMRAVVKGMVELDQGRETSLAEVKERLGLA